MMGGKRKPTSGSRLTAPVPLKTKMIEALTLPSETFTMPSTAWVMCDMLVEARGRLRLVGHDFTHQLILMLTRKEITLERSKHLVGREQQLLRCAGWLRVRFAPVRPGDDRMARPTRPVLP